MPAVRHVLCVGLTPALQDTRVVERFRMGEVNRCRSVTYSAAGKGANVARVVRTLKGRALVTGFVGGDTGRLLFAEPGAQYVRTRSPTRVCVTILDQRTVTELVGEAALPSPVEWRAFYRRFDRLLARTGLIAISGALMPGARKDVYANLLDRAKRRGIPVIIDSQREPLLLSLRHRPLVAKLNVHELENTVGKVSILRGARRLMELGAQNVLVTDGARGATLVGADGAWHFTPPRIRPVNPIGSGDAVSAGIAVGISKGQRLEDAVRLGIACGTANALTLLPGCVNVRDVRRLLPQVKVRRVA